MADARLRGDALPFSFDGKLYKWVPRTFAAECAFQVHQETEAYRAIQRHRGILSPEDYAAQLTGWRHDLSAKVFSWGEPLSWRYLWSLPGSKHMAFLQLKEGEAHGGEAVDLHLIDRIAADSEKWEELNSLMLATDYPNLRRPEKDVPAGG